MIPALTQQSVDGNFSCQRDVLVSPAPARYLPHQDRGTLLSCSWRFLPSEDAYVGFKPKTFQPKTNTYNRLQQGMEGKDKHNVTGGCHFVSWHLLAAICFWVLFKVILSLCSQISSLACPAREAASSGQGLVRDIRTNFSHSAGVPGKGVCPSEVHVSTTPPSLEVCCACPPCWLPPRLLPLILILPTAIACGVSFSHFTIILYWCWKFRSLFTEITSPCDTPKAAGRPAQCLCQLPSQGEQIPGWTGTWGREGDVSSEQSKNSLLTPCFWECHGCLWVGWDKSFETAWNSCWLKSLGARVGLPALLWCLSPSSLMQEQSAA